jgi:hypothetical protein
MIRDLDMLIGPALVVLVVMVGMLLGPKESYITAGMAMVVWAISNCCSETGSPGRSRCRNRWACGACG